MRILFFLIFFAFTTISAQNIQGIVYKNVLSKDKRSIIYYDQNRSLYIAESKKNETSIKHMPDGSVVYPINTIDSIANKSRFVYFDNKSKIFYNNIINYNTETILHENVKINWTITNEKKKILNFQCQKAIGEINNIDRKYVVWYAKQLPLPYGPFKINGLEGIILELYTSDNKIHLIADEVIDTIDKDKINDFISKYDFSKSITRESYKIVLEKQLVNFENKLNNTLPEGKKVRFKENCKKCNK